MIFIYAIKNRLNNKYYVGSTINKDKRLKEHLESLNKGTHNSKFQKDWDCHNKEDWEFVILEEGVPQEFQFISEQYWIDLLDSFNNGYNAHSRAGSYNYVRELSSNNIQEKRKQDVEEILKLLKKKVPYRTISKEYGVSLGFLSSLKKKYSKNFLDMVEDNKEKAELAASNRKKTIENKKQKILRNKEIIRLYKEGLPYRSISDKIECSLGTVCNIINKIE